MRDSVDKVVQSINQSIDGIFIVPPTKHRRQRLSTYRPTITLKTKLKMKTTHTSSIKKLSEMSGRRSEFFDNGVDYSWHRGSELNKAVKLFHDR